MIATEKIDLVSVGQAAAMLGKTRGCVHHHRLTGRLPAITIDGRYLIPRADVERLRAERDALANEPETFAI